MNTDILSFEFEWYLRDYFFRINDSYGGEFNRIFDSDEICRFMKENYLKYRNLNMKEITELFSTVISDLNNRNVLIVKKYNGAVMLNQGLNVSNAQIAIILIVYPHRNY